ncbi:odorant receptor 131-2-like [Dendropsophus ebraccatus]|uniref:odorant receptor 131-2-like n=1 Tax=Dendropsophus ebraccatus TaxID=150705 RepID=UPI0038313A97
MKILEEKNNCPRMVNLSLLQSNMSDVSIPSNKLVEYARLTLILLIILGYCFFTCFITMILNVFFMTSHLRDNTRYVLFVYMLVNDTYFLYSGLYFLLGSLYELHVPVPLCFFLYTLSTVAFKVTPYSLAAMAVEQYVAICHPLRRVELCTTYRAHVTFAMIFTWLAIPCAIELCFMFSSMTNIFNLHIICRQNLLVVSPIQFVIRSITLVLCFSIVGLVIFITYVKIMLVAHRLSSGSSSASKAGKTVMLHAFQLLLCMGSLLSNLTESFQMKQAELQPLINFFIFTCLPRLLSPMIYGFRDEALRKYMKSSLARFVHNFNGRNEGWVFR